MNKKLTASLLGCAIAMGTIMPVAACKIELKPKLPVWDSNVTITQLGADVSWEKVPGAEKYEIYYSPSRFGTYSLESTQTTCKYMGDDKYGYYRVVAIDGAGKEIASNLYSYEIETFGNNMHIYADTDDQKLIQQDIDRFKNATSQFADKEIYERLYEQNDDGDWVAVQGDLIGEGRFAGLFKEGKYNNLNLQMRYYMTFAGLGELPTQAELGGFYTNGELSGGNATCNFWCGIENLTVNSNVQWAVSQATSFRRMKINGDLILFDARPESKTPWCSGGFVSDSVVTGKINCGYQQQWFTRNSDWGNWVNGDINVVFAGCSGKLSNYKWGNYGNGWVTYLDETKVMREKPFLTFDENYGYSVCLPELKTNYKGTTWSEDEDYVDENEYISIDNFYVARSDRDTAKTINAALKNGKHILFTPGIYDIDSPLLVERQDTIIMGIGLATLRLTGKNTDTIMRVSDVDGVKISGLIFDAGPSSKTLLELGKEKTVVSHEENPTVLNDVYFRIGGAKQGNTSVDVTLLINSNNVVGDNFWVWRADHSYGVGWNVNRAKNGVIINGDDVTIYGLMVEHFQEYQTIWNGENGFMAFYQSETPYDPVSQEDWMSEWNGEIYEGYASYKVADGVQKHTAYGLGVYYVASSRLHNVFTLDHGIELPSNEGIDVQHIGIANFLSYGDKQTTGGIRHIVNGYGKSNFDGSKQHWQSFIGGIATP